MKENFLCLCMCLTMMVSEHAEGCTLEYYTATCFDYYDYVDSSSGNIITVRALTLENLNDVINEVGLSNQLFVLAQAVLETGYFSSRVCRVYNNLFGLYDSKHHRYFRFKRWEDRVIAYKKMIQYRYKGGSYLKFLDRIGYAESPNYTSEVAKVAKRLYKELYPE